MGNRIQKDSTANGNRKYIVDITGGLPVILCEFDPCETYNRSLKKAYIYANGQILAQYDCNGFNTDTNSVIVNGKYFYLVRYKY